MGLLKMRRKGLNFVSTVRPLTAEEISVVAGGYDDDIVVEGKRLQENRFDWGNYGGGSYGGGYGGGYGYGGGPSGGYYGGSDPSQDPDTSTDPVDQDGISDETQDHIKDGMDGLKAKLDAAIAKYGDFDLKVGDKTYKASQLASGADKVSKMFDALTGAQLVSGLMKGDADVGAISGFLAGMAATSLATAAGAGPVAVFAAGLAAGAGAEYGYNFIATTVATAVNNHFAAAQTHLQQANPGFNSLPSSVQIYQYITEGFGGAPAQNPLPGTGEQHYYNENYYREFNGGIREQYYYIP